MTLKDIKESLDLMDELNFCSDIDDLIKLGLDSKEIHHLQNDKGWPFDLIQYYFNHKIFLELREKVGESL